MKVIFMWGFNKQKQSNPDGINLLAAILVCCPEITSVSYDPNTETVSLTFTLKNPMSQKAFDELANFLGESIAAYQALEGYGETGIDFSMDIQGELGFFHIKRDLKTISRGEIMLTVSLVKERCGDTLIMDATAGERMDPDFRAAQEEVIERTLGNVQQIKLADKLVGIREEDHVVVFNR